ncbi:hypothetical protein AUK14_01780 [Candidatus Berkelbacteria bacterium CG2_30_39_44]|nr:MAG: hypothetical protein AUK14_01780 [Candidatus Berkelbacteria bacterium CG2_30_39_44]PIX30699.1 MAG: hypothetical protein COZ62_01285 [Candidatus Berkelbacteria bacterium CG_4_8_14_3_um_filter_39_27]PIZ28625.1 MAG: hypothetical protein COY44_03170 [Candidatus Berkelbacteria bacterium CG_4_10_14_0_8_um_filter_39_42]
MRIYQHRQAKNIEKYFKGMANHWRIDILDTIAKYPGITVEGIAEYLNANFKTISEHTRKLTSFGLVNKKYRGRYVSHELSPYGKRFNSFAKTFQHSG